jgi:GABA permease
MTWKRSVLVVANVTAASDELVRALRTQAEQGPCSFMLIVPATPFGGGRQAALDSLSSALEQLRGVGLEAEGGVGDGDPLVAVSEAWDPKRYDEIVVSTLPIRLSTWLRAGLPERISRLTGAPVTHVVSEPPKPPVETAPPPAHNSPGDVMGPLQVLGWGGHKEQ